MQPQKGLLYFLSILHIIPQSNKWIKQQKEEIMYYSQKVAEAMRWAEAAHRGSVDKAGYPYIFHPIAVAEAVDNAIDRHYGWDDKEDFICVALLHDVVEDTSSSIPDGNIRDAILKKISDTFGSSVSKAVDAISRREGETYNEYIQRVGKNYIARFVKLKDLSHNMSPDRQKLVEDFSESLNKRYKKAYAYLLKQEQEQSLNFF